MLDRMDVQELLDTYALARMQVLAYSVVYNDLSLAFLWELILLTKYSIKVCSWTTDGPLPNFQFNGRILGVAAYAADIL